MPVLKRDFFARDTLTVARELLGNKLIREYQGHILGGIIYETEAYLGQSDSACHSYKGKTKRNAVLFGEPGVAYVYFVYGLHNMLNVVSEELGSPCAVLIRRIKPVEGLAQMKYHLGKEIKRTINGPAQVCKALAIDRSLNGWDLTRGKYLWVEPFKTVPESMIYKAPRIGIEYALPEHKQAPWRMGIDEKGLQE